MDFPCQGGARSGSDRRWRGTRAHEGAPQDPDISTIKATPLMVNGILYFATPDNAWAVDARSGHEIWHYFWKTRAASISAIAAWACTATGCSSKRPTTTWSRSMRDTGKERWHKQIADVKQEYFSTPAPVIVGNHVMVGTGGDSLDVPGFLEARDPETGDDAMEVVERAAEERRPRLRDLARRDTRCGTAAA